MVVIVVVLMLVIVVLVEITVVVLVVVVVPIMAVIWVVIYHRQPKYTLVLIYAVHTVSQQRSDSYKRLFMGKLSFFENFRKCLQKGQ